MQQLDRSINNKSLVFTDSILFSRQAPSTMMANLAEADEEEVRLEEEQEAKLAELEAEMENEKEARKLAGATEEEIQRAMELLQKQHDAKRKVNFLFLKDLSFVRTELVFKEATLLFLLLGMHG